MHEEIKWLLLLIIALFVGWVLTNGPARVADNKDKPFIEEPAPLSNGQVYGLDELKDRTRP